MYGEDREVKREKKGKYAEKRERERYEEMRGGKCFIEQKATLNIINPLLETTHGRERSSKFWSNIGCD